MKLKSQTPHIGIFGRRNNGKSSLINSLCNQEVAIVSDCAGTTTDPVRKRMEIEGIGPVVFSDTAGVDDVGVVGQKRVEATFREIGRIDLALLVFCSNLFGKEEEELILRFNQFEIPFILLHHKKDVESITFHLKEQLQSQYGASLMDYSSKTEEGKEELVDLIRSTLPPSVFHRSTLIGDLLPKGSFVLLIAPIDSEAPEGRLILPQVQVIRDGLDNHFITTIIQESEIPLWFSQSYPKPDLVITDSQSFKKVAELIPEEIPLTGFSVVLARNKGPFVAYLKGTPAIDRLKEGDRILILESCTHHVSCEDIGRVKIPNWLKKRTGKNFEFETVAGLDDPDLKIESYALVIQCGGCMITKQQLKTRLMPAIVAGIPVTNYGMTIAWCLGIYERAVAPFWGKI